MTVSCHRANQNSEFLKEEEIIAFPPIEVGEFFYKNTDPFDSIIEYTGEQLFKDHILFAQPSEMIIKENQLLMRSISGQSDEYRNSKSIHFIPLVQSKSFVFFSYPSLKFQISLSDTIQKNEELWQTYLVFSSDTTVFCYLFEKGLNKMFKLNNTGIIESYSLPLFENFGRYSVHNIANIAPEEFIFTKDSLIQVDNKRIMMSKICKVSQERGSAVMEDVYDLSFDVQGEFASFYGSLVVNPQLNRMVHIYHGFKIIKFMDMESSNIRTLNFEKESVHDTIQYKQSDISYSNVCVRDDYIYVKYQISVSGDESAWIVEQYDWNGNPKNRYKLDSDGYYFLDEQNNEMIYETYLRG